MRNYIICPLCGGPAKLDNLTIVCKVCSPKIEKCKDGVKCTKCVKEDYPKK